MRIQSSSMKAGHGKGDAGPTHHFVYLRISGYTRSCGLYLNKDHRVSE